MKLITKMSAIALATSMLLPVAALATGVFGNSLTIVNNTNQDSTTIINGGPCSSTVLGASGVTKAHSTNVVSPIQLALACITDKNNCKADVYMTNNCTGNQVATVVFSTSTGIKTVNPLDPNYQMSGSGFNAQIDGGL